MTLQQQKQLKIGLIAALILGAFLFVYLKWMRPRMQKKREEERVKETIIVTAAQTGPMPEPPLPQIAPQPEQPKSTMPPVILDGDTNDITRTLAGGDQVALPVVGIGGGDSTLG